MEAEEKYPHCAICKFYDRQETNCKRYPPPAFWGSEHELNQNSIVAWPDVFPDDCCGEFIEGPEFALTPIK